MNILVKILATSFGIGLSPIAPGTLASAAAVLLFKFVLSGLAWPVYLALVIILTLAGVVVSSKYAVLRGEADPSRVVIDEVCGQLAALVLVPTSWPWLGAAFVLFRFFDIIKPYPIRKLERLRGGWGIMADDIAAGAAALVIVHAARLVI